MSIAIKVIDPGTDHVIIETTEPSRFEVSLIGEGPNIIIHGWTEAQ